MKNLIFAFVTIIIALSANSFTLFKPPFDDIEIVFNGSMGKTDLDLIQKDLSQKGIILKYESLKFNKNGKLKYIQFSVDCPNEGFQGKASNKHWGFSKKFGFCVRYTKTRNADFKIGHF